MARNIAATRQRRAAKRQNIVGRGKLIERYIDEVKQKRSTDPDASDAIRVWNLYGPGGLGKSTLSRKFVEAVKGLQSSGTRVALADVNFDPRSSNTDPEKALLQIRRQLATSSNVPTPAFTYVLIKLAALEEPGVDLREKYSDLFRSGLWEGGDDLLSVAWEGAKKLAGGALDVAPAANIVARTLRKVMIKGLETWEQGKIRDYIGYIDELFEDNDDEELRTELARSLGDDLCRAIEHGEAKSKPLTACVVLDTYEAIWADAKSDRDLTRDDWVREFCKCAAGAHVTILGRNKILWDKADQDWHPDVVTERLADLTPADAIEFLDAKGVDEGEIRDRIIETSGGLPLYLELSSETYLKIKGSGRTPEVEDFASTQSQVLENFVNHLDEWQKKELRLASYPTKITEEIFNYLSQTVFGGAGLSEWENVERQGFVSESDDGLIMHSMVRDFLQDDDKQKRPDLYSRIHEALWAYHVRDLPTDPEEGLTEDQEMSYFRAYYHLHLADKDKAKRWVVEFGKDCELSNRWNAISANSRSWAETFGDPQINALYSKILSREQQRSTLTSQMKGGMNVGTSALLSKVLSTFGDLEQPTQEAQNKRIAIMGEADEQRDHLVQIIRKKENFSEDAASVLQRLVDLAAVYNMMNDTKQAGNTIKLLEGAMKMYFGESNYTVPGQRLETGINLYQRGKHDEAAKHLSAADVLNRHEDDCFRALHMRAANLVAMKRPKEAMALIDKSIDGQRRGMQFLPSRNPDLEHWRLGYAHFLKADLQRDKGFGDHGAEEARLAREQWRKMETPVPDDSLVVQEADLIWKEADVLLGKESHHLLPGGAVRPPRGTAGGRPSLHGLLVDQMDQENFLSMPRAPKSPAPAALAAP